MKNRERAIEVLVGDEHATLEDAAEAAGISPRSLRRWRNDPEFSDLLQAARAERRERLMAVAEETAFEAVERLRDLAGSESTPAYVRANVLTALLTWSTNLQADDQRAEIDELEALLDRRGY